MRYQEIGQSGIEASVITFGAMGVGGGFRYPDADDAESIRAIHHALDEGINFIDTAPVYGFGHSEEVIGKAIKGRRDKVVISTKCGLWWGDDEGSYRFTWEGKEVRRNLSPRTLRIELERSLKLLQTDYIDVYYTHNPACPPFLTPIEETIDVLNEFKKEGKIRTIGVSNCETHHIQSYLERGDLSIVQRKYNILDRTTAGEVLPFAKEHNLSFHGYSTLEKGLLAGTIKKGYSAEDDPVRNDGSALWKQPGLDIAIEFAESLERDIASDLGLTLAELSVAYSISQGVNPLIGIRKERHVDSVIRAADVDLPGDVIAEINARADATLARIEQQR